MKSRKIFVTVFTNNKTAIVLPQDDNITTKFAWGEISPMIAFKG